MKKQKLIIAVSMVLVAVVAVMLVFKSGGSVKKDRENHSMDASFFQRWY